MDKFVVLARGLGTRMRRRQTGSILTEAQAAVADTGVKALMPIGRPFLDYVLGAAVEAGFRRLCLVVGPDHDALRDYYGRQLRPRRLSVEFAVQRRPLGTADAVRAAREFAGDDPFAVLNSDNHYPVRALRALRELNGPGLAAFGREAMMRDGNIDAERINRFAVIQQTADGYLDRVIEKPDPRWLARTTGPVFVSMNCWRFGAEIFDACAAVRRSARGEFELPDAVQLAIETMGVRFATVAIDAPVLDLSGRADVAAIAELLRDEPVNL